MDVLSHKMDTRAYYFMGNMGANVIKCLKWEKDNFGELEIESLHFCTNECMVWG